jgi:hypothetical protein
MDRGRPPRTPAEGPRPRPALPLECAGPRLGPCPRPALPLECAGPRLGPCPGPARPRSFGLRPAPTRGRRPRRAPAKSPCPEPAGEPVRRSGGRHSSASGCLWPPQSFRPPRCGRPAGGHVGGLRHLLWAVLRGLQVFETRNCGCRRARPRNGDNGRSLRLSRGEIPERLRRREYSRRRGSSWSDGRRDPVGRSPIFCKRRAAAVSKSPGPAARGRCPPVPAAAGTATPRGRPPPSAGVHARGWQSFPPRVYAGRKRATSPAP